MRQLRLLRVSRARTPDAATDQISPAAGAGAEVVGIGERGAGAGGEEGRRGSGGGLGAVARGVEADGAGALYADPGVSICPSEVGNGSLGSVKGFPCSGNVSCDSISNTRWEEGSAPKCTYLGGAGGAVVVVEGDVAAGYDARAGIAAGADDLG